MIAVVLENKSCLCGTPTLKLYYISKPLYLEEINLPLKQLPGLKPFSIKLDVGSVSMTGVPPTSPSGGEKKAAQWSAFCFQPCCLPARSTLWQRGVTRVSPPNHKKFSFPASGFLAGRPRV